MEADVVTAASPSAIAALSGMDKREVDLARYCTSGRKLSTAGRYVGLHRPEEDAMAAPLKEMFVTCEYGVPGNWQAGRHTGRDFRAVIGTPIYATADGHVVSADALAWGEGYGLHVVIESHVDGVAVRHGYCHLSRHSVTVGQSVKEGQRIATSGDTGRTFGAHLHYEERLAPFLYADHDRRPTLPSAGPDTSPWASGDVYVSKLHKGQDDSDSVRRLQYRLLHHPDVPAVGVSVTGFYGDGTEAAVQFWQRNIADLDQPDHQDGMRMSLRQAQRLFGENYKVIDQ
jgi:Peptidase family M23